QHVVHLITHVLRERCKRFRKVVQSSRKLPRAVPLIHMRVPSTNVGERNFQTYIRLDELRNLHEPLTELRFRIDGAVPWRVLLRVCALHELDCVEHLLPGSVHEIRTPRAVKRLEPLGLAPRRTNRKLTQRAHCNRLGGALEYARRLRRHRNRTERLGLTLLARPLHREKPIEPAVWRPLHVRRSRFHEVLSVEVRPRRARTSYGMDRRQQLLIPERLERRKRWMQSEE